MGYEPNKMCKRFVDVNKLREVEGQLFGSVKALERAIGWDAYTSGNMKHCDLKRLQHYCELKFEQDSQRVTVVKVY
ncbi:hypothetical protein [Turicibacter sp. TJ11]|uniref:hypothetical protein n=1 Tax=Turicibacter sp. TJ11 TaxID=2806443 RepID=UPI001F23388A|nr:hypothetical protein [Turicibacter sp. TJ11]